MSATAPATSPRRRELLELAYAYVLEHGVSDLSLRPLAAAVGSSPRVLLFLFGSKAELVQALLARAREDELELLRRVRAASGAEGGDLLAVAAELWSWLSTAERRGLLTLWVEGYARSLVDPDGPWAGFAAATVADWLEVLTAAAQAPRARAGGRAAGAVEPTLVLAVLRGALLDLLATGEVERTTRAVNWQLALLRGGPA
ncbi:MAG: TetR/AcrR family transcriptional regulator [Solirubrobacteraceae bacterium]